MTTAGPTVAGMQPPPRTGRGRRVLRLVGITVVVVLVALAVDIGYFAYAHGRDAHRKRTDAQRQALATAEQFAGRLRAGLARGGVRLRSVQPSGIALLGSTRTGTQATVTYQAVADIHGTAMFGEAVILCFADHVDLASRPPSVTHEQISCRDLLPDDTADVLVPR